MPNLFNRGWRNPGTYTLNPIAIPQGAVGFIVTLDRRDLNNIDRGAPDNTNRQNEVAQIDTECSLDGGQTWFGWHGFGIEGGEYLEGWLDPIPAIDSEITGTLPGDPQSTSRMIRATLTIHVRLRTMSTAEWLF